LRVLGRNLGSFRTSRSATVLRVVKAKEPPISALSARPIRRLAAAALVAVLAAVVLTGNGAVSAQQSDARSQRAQVRSQQAAIAAQVNALEADQRKVTAALAALDANVRGQNAALKNAESLAVSAAEEAERSEREAAEIEKQVEELKKELTAFAVYQYVNPPSDDLVRSLQAESAQLEATRRALMEVSSTSSTDVLDKMRAARQRLQETQARAISSRLEAERQAANAQQALVSLETAKSQQAAYAEQVRARLDERLREAQHLASIDASLAARIRAEEAALANQIRNVPPPPPSNTPPPSISRPPLRTVGGITVNASIADDLAALLAAARSAGFNLGGYGYRDINAQIQLRRQNCGTSDYAVWQMPADQCSPPTARPGYSAHERGLAVDFQSNGVFINTQSNPAFRWLAANAGRYGFINLPSEPWHWSHPG